MTEHKWTRRSARLLLLATAAPAMAQNVSESRHYRIYSDLDPAATRDYAKRLDAMYDEYSRRLSDFADGNGTKFEVHLFKKQSDYRTFTGNRLPNSSGMFIPSRQALAGYEESQGRQMLRQTLQHEAFHQFAWSRISPNLPIWLDEGLAQVFEEGVWTGDQFLLGQVPPNRIRVLQHDLNEGSLLPVGDLLSMSRTTFQARMRDDAMARTEYNQAWAMTQFLVFATDSRGQPRFRQRLINWLRDLHTGHDAQQAFVANFSSNTAGFEKLFRAWAAELQPTPLAVYSDRVSKLAELVRLFRQEGQAFDSVEALRRHLERGQFHLSEQRDGQTYTLDEDALTYLSDLNGKPWPDGSLFFDARRGPLPDIVLRPANGSAIRARFYADGGRIDHDLIFEKP